MDTILLKGIRAIDAENDFIADIYIADGKIKHVADSIEMKADIEIDGTGLAVMPSFFDNAGYTKILSLAPESL